MLLLHPAEALTTAATANDWPLIAAAGVLGVALGVIWAPVAAHVAGCGRRRRRAAGLAVAIIAALAVLPSVFPYDHLLARASHDGEHVSVHNAHCHDEPGSCADAPVTSGPGQLMQNGALLPQPALLSLLILLVLPVLAGVTRRPELPPPLATA